MSLEMIGIVLSYTLKLFSVYFLAVSLFAIFTRQEYDHAPPKTKFAVVIAARNEEAVIGNIVESLKNQTYPSELYDIFVVPNNCDDDTAGAARAAGAEVLTCVHPVTCKGEVLHHTFAWLMEEYPEYDAFCVFDADNIVDRQYLTKLNNAFAGGARVIKGRIEAANPYDSWISGCYAIYFGMFHTFYNKARASCGLSAKLVGTGFALHRDVLVNADGWNTETIAEDAEFAAHLAQLGERVVYVPQAVAYDEEPNSFAVSMTQRRRWCSGIMQVSFKELGNVFASLKSGDKLALKIDSIMFLLSPFVQVLAIVPLLISLLSAMLTGPLALTDFIGSLLLLAGASYVGATLLAGFITILHGGWDTRIFKSILTYGVFMASWIPLQVAALFRKSTKWVPISHGKQHALQRPSLQ